MTAFYLRGASPTFEGDLFSRFPGNRLSRGEVPARAGVLHRIVGAGAMRLREHFRRRRVMAELSRLSDRELADIGLSRSEIGLIYSPEFAARRHAERGD